MHPQRSWRLLSKGGKNGKIKMGNGVQRDGGWGFCYALIVKLHIRNKVFN